MFSVMIEPWAKDVWSGKCHNEIYIDANQLIGAGVSLRVLMHAFKGQNHVWFSAIYGMHHDNCVAYGVRPEIADTFPKEAAEDVPPIQAALKEDFKLEEYPLTEEVQSARGVKIEDPGDDGDLHEEGMQNVHCRVHVHDDCFFNVKPLDDLLLRRLISCILEQHSFYLKQEIDWSQVLEEIVQIISSAPAVAFKSYPRRQILKLVCKKPGVQMLDALLGKRRRYMIETIGGKARFMHKPDLAKMNG